MVVVKVVLLVVEVEVAVKVVLLAVVGVRKVVLLAVKVAGEATMALQEGFGVSFFWEEVSLLLLLLL